MGVEDLDTSATGAGGGGEKGLWRNWERGREGERELERKENCSPDGNPHQPDLR